VEWAARDALGSAHTSPVTSRLPPSSIFEDARSEDVAPMARPPATPTPNPSSNDYLLTPEPDHPPATSPDPITPGYVIDSTVSQPNSPGPSSLLTDHKPFSQHSAPAEMGRPHERLSGSKSLQSGGTWDEVKKRRLQIKAECEDTLEGIGEETPPDGDQGEVKENEAIPDEKGESLQRPAPLSITACPAETLVDRVPVPPGDSAPAGGGRAVGWGTPFKVQWVRTDPLSFHRTKHVKNPWNNDVRFQMSSRFFADLFPA